MLIEVKVKVARVIDGKTRKRTETYLLDKEVYAEAELAVMTHLSQEQQQGLVTSSEILSLKQSPVKEVCTQFQGQYSFMATLIDTFVQEDGTEKALKYKVLLWADTLTQANTNVQRLARQGYSMQVEGLKQVNYEYIAN